MYTCFWSKGDHYRQVIAKHLLLLENQPAFKFENWECTNRWCTCNSIPSPKYMYEYSLLTPPTFALVRNAASSSGRGSLEQVLTVEMSNARNSLPWTFSMPCTSIYNHIMYITSRDNERQTYSVQYTCVHVHVHLPLSWGGGTSSPWIEFAPAL